MNTNIQGDFQIYISVPLKRRGCLKEGGVYFVIQALRESLKKEGGVLLNGSFAGF